MLFAWKCTTQLTCVTAWVTVHLHELLTINCGDSSGWSRSPHINLIKRWAKLYWFQQHLRATSDDPVLWYPSILKRNSNTKYAWRLSSKFFHTRFSLLYSYKSTTALFQWTRVGHLNSSNFRETLHNHANPVAWCYQNIML